MPISAALLQRGHLATCVFVNNFSPACDCDGTYLNTLESIERRARIVEALSFDGWQARGQTAGGAAGCGWPCPSFYRRLDATQVVMLSKVISGWQFLWMKGHMTIAEGGSYGTPQACLAGFWSEVAAFWDQYHEMLIANARATLQAR